MPPHVRDQAPTEKPRRRKFCSSNACRSGGRSRALRSGPRQREAPDLSVTLRTTGANRRWLDLPAHRRPLNQEKYRRGGGERCGGYPQCWQPRATAARPAGAPSWSFPRSPDAARVATREAHACECPPRRSGVGDWQLPRICPASSGALELPDPRPRRGYDTLEHDAPGAAQPANCEAGTRVVELAARVSLKAISVRWCRHRAESAPLFEGLDIRRELREGLVGDHASPMGHADDGLLPEDAAALDDVDDFGVRVELAPEVRPERRD